MHDNRQLWCDIARNRVGTVISRDEDEDDSRETSVAETHSADYPDCLPVLLSISVSTFQFYYFHFVVVGFVR